MKEGNVVEPKFHNSC